MTSSDSSRHTPTGHGSGAADAKQVLDFWFDPVNREHWFRASGEFDEVIRKRFHEPYGEAAQGQLIDWCETPNGALSLCILLDQVSRNIFRGTSQAFATDSLARASARQILARGFDRLYPMDEHRMFCYLPFEHSEDINDQRLSVQLFSEHISNTEYADYARRHFDVIERFGRFPHRNSILGRASTLEEVEFLCLAGSSF
jgi:uncharacterized protein (DUF924 family)